MPEHTLSEQRRELSRFKKLVESTVTEAGYKVCDTLAKNANRYIKFDIEYTSHYPSNISLRSHIQLEFKVGSTRLSPEYKSVSSFYSILANNEPEVSRIACINPVETAVDKLSALVWRIPNRIRGGELDDMMLVRHIHDLAALDTLIQQSPLFSEMVISTIQTDNDFIGKKRHEFAAMSTTDKCKQLLSILHEDVEYRGEYDRFVKNVSYHQTSQPPDYDTAIKLVIRLVQEIIDKCDR
ncbi:MAG: nucleotidyl transferase AbiEii/AbiGii toxin family protein [Saprospiraceae bacterium]|nr:nucleotidyl transferase AbiEii/AbiGii toxin family protein [Saprospiraceae bacterium]